MFSALNAFQLLVFEINSTVAGLKISGRYSYFASINFVLTTLILNAVVNVMPGFFYLLGAIGT